MLCSHLIISTTHPAPPRRDAQKEEKRGGQEKEEGGTRGNAREGERKTGEKQNTSKLTRTPRCRTVQRRGSYTKGGPARPTIGGSTSHSFHMGAAENAPPTHCLNTRVYHTRGTAWCSLSTATMFEVGVLVRRLSALVMPIASKSNHKWNENGVGNDAVVRRNGECHGLHCPCKHQN
jgi:hypothetical protein